jgi:hypothetical protein
MRTSPGGAKENPLQIGKNLFANRANSDSRNEEILSHNAPMPLESGFSL